jgi:hypothetical protein
MFNGQAGQDKFVINILKEKCNGFFLEIGSNDPIEINNSYILEKKYNWKGIMIEYDKKFKDLYKIHRSNSIHIFEDATKINYKDLLKENNFPNNIDYLQIDIEADNGSTIKALEILDESVMDNYKFSVITFEHDYKYNNKADIVKYTREKSREIFKKRGYVCVFPDVHNIIPYNVFEDWYVHPDLVDMKYVNNLILNNKDKYVPNENTIKSIDWKNIKYI